MSTRRWWCVLLASGLLACGPESNKPAGTMSDPVDVCADVGQICRYDGSQLGVCGKTTHGTGGLSCVPQH